MIEQSLNGVNECECALSSIELRANCFKQHNHILWFIVIACWCNLFSNILMLAYWLIAENELKAKVLKLEGELEVREEFH